METYARRFAALAREAGAEVILFQTWARLDQPETEEPPSSTPFSASKSDRRRPA